MALSRRLIRATIRLSLVTAVLGGGIACLVQKPKVVQLDPKHPPIEVRSPVKAHLVDGSTVLYPGGVQLQGNFLATPGTRFMLGSSVPVSTSRISLDSIVGMEAFDTGYDIPASVVASIPTTAGAAVLTALAVFAVFGSCPTFYADSAGTQVLQAEGFSYSIAPLFENRDVDRLRLTPRADGSVAVYVRNEALETHFINHLELIEVSHKAGEIALPDQQRQAIVVREIHAPAIVRDRAGRNVADLIRTMDGVTFSSDPQTVRNVSSTDLDDYIDLTIAMPNDADSIAILLDMRNSLLNTVLLYDHMLAAPGIRSLDWVGRDMDNIAGAIEMGRWYNSRMGMRISVLEDGKYRQVARIGDSGPIAYRDNAIVIPAIRSVGDSVRVRLSFIADNWRIDAIRAATSLRRPASRLVSAARVRMTDQAQNTPALASLREADEAYLITSPGQSFSVEFDIGHSAPGTRTYMLAAQGYYTEWVRGSWIKHASGTPFKPSDAFLVEALRGWRTKQVELEKQFYSTRISTR
ncbi:MAG: hypothetical protein ABIW94_10225 [Gemmatimonadaceae bacterium]